MIQFTLNLIPKAWGRPRAVAIAGHAKIFAPPETEQAVREIVALADPHAPPAPFQGPLAVRLTFNLLIPRSKPAWWQAAAEAGAVYPTSRPDADNLAKLVLDALSRSGRWWRDDAQIVHLESTKAFGAIPGTRVVIEPLPEVDSAAWKARARQRAEEAA